MRAGAHAAAALEILADLEVRRRPVPDAVKDWGLAHRFAGSRDRATVSGLVYDVLRRRASLAWRMGQDTPRALLLGALAFSRGQGPDAIAAAFADSPHAPPPPSDAERRQLADGTLADAPAWVRGDYPEWLDPFFARSLGDERVAEGAAMAERAPLDLRVNTLKGDREQALAALGHLDPTATPLSPWGLRVPQLDDGRGPPVHAEPAFLKGLVEVQDEGSQLAALLAGVAPGQQVIDLCAGAGGKTLALAAVMDNRGQLYAHDKDLRRLAPLHERAQRAGVRNLQIRAPRGRHDVMRDFAGRADVVLVDAPCTGTGTWRRSPDAKWRLRPNALAGRQAEQDAALVDAARLVKPGGRLVYVTCSLLREENDDRLDAFRAAQPDFVPIAPAELALSAGLAPLLARAHVGERSMLLTPGRTGTDGFFVAALRREA